MNRRPTIIDIARAAGVSKSLVSRAIRGEAGVSEASRARILTVADELGYRSNRWARSLKRGRAELIGVLLTDLDNTYHTDVVHGIENAAVDVGLEVVLSHGRRDPDVLAGRLEALQLLGVDGLVVVSAMVDGPQLATVAAATPVVVVGRPDDLPASVGAVANNDERGARLAVEHLVALGHRRISHALGSPRPASRARHAAYLTTMERMALTAHVDVVPHDALDDLIEAIAAGAHSAPTAVFAANDRIAARLVGAAVDAGLRVPDDLSIVGYDNSTAAQLLRPALTTVDQPRQRMGKEAMQQLSALIRGVAQPTHVVLEPSLVVRDSTAPPRRG